MTSQEALDLVDQIAAVYRGTREDHVNLQLAVAQLRQLVEKNIISKDNTKK